MSTPIPWEKEHYADLDEGVRFAVKVLHAAGIYTGQSCQGGEGHAYAEPTVDLWADEFSTGWAALHALTQYGLPVESISRTWSIENGEPRGPFWRIIFRRTMSERADEFPVFVMRSTTEQFDGSPSDTERAK